MRERIAFYDMDRTITVHPTYARFLLWMALRHDPKRLLLLPLSALAGLGYLMRIVRRDKLKQINQRLLLGSLRLAGLAAPMAAHAEFVFAKNIRPGALAQIAADRAAGYRIVIATASYRLYVEAIARRLGVDDVIATDLTASRGRVQPHIAGHNCYGPHKAEMMMAWMARNGLDRAACHIRCYSDHLSDLPMLELSDEAFVTNAYLPMRLVARQKGWPELDWPAGGDHVVALPTLPG
ncbi:HAD family phosphatase [Blastomonas sp.]|uniref:HAD family hydrolase n=1 Tax=Blastomonas sp. TaxID=1909299 RepID=UPI00260A513C|nr:HAD-IB family hydrolase [Blastomonas sp.]MDM7956808.1 HAD-IB family hydrolase [Blastomonas sp.]